MSLFSKLFGKRKQLSVATPAITPENNSNIVSEDQIPNKDLFVASEEPPKRLIQNEQPSKITLFLSRNYNALGVRDGFEYHSSENLVTGKRKIGSEFRLILDLEIQEKEEKRLQVENLIVDVSSVSALTSQKLQNTLQRINDAIILLVKQKELSIEEEGWVMNAIYSYQQGFVQGLSDYIDSESLLNSTKNI